MARLRTVIALSLAALAVAPACALAKPRAQVLRDVAPLGTHFKDRVISSSAPLAHASLAATDWQSYTAPDGINVAAAISSRYATTLSESVVQSYVDFLDSLDHGPELGTLRIYIAPPDEVTADCGGQDGTLACYDSNTKIMYVPGEEEDTGSSGVTTSYVVAHEYGHHIAAARSNPPFNAFAYGPKYWASYEMVCNRAQQGQLAPGNEQQYYLSNPGEGWAETYAQLKYPGVEWQYTPLLQPDAGAFAAAKRDVLNPWEAGVTKLFKGSFGRGGTSSKRYSFDLTLDGALRMTLHGPRATNYNLKISSNGRSEGGTTSSGSRDSVSYQAACRQDQLEHVTVAVKRVKGSGPFTLRVNYAG